METANRLFWTAIVSSLPNPLTPQTALSLLATFHDLRGKGTALSRSDEDQRELTLIRDLFEPRRVTSQGVRRLPIRLVVYRPGRMAAAGRIQPVRVCMLSLHELKALASRLHLPEVGDAARLDIEADRGPDWHSFAGTVTAVDGALGCVTVALDDPMRRRTGRSQDR